MRGSQDAGRGGVRGTGERSALRTSFRDAGAVRLSLSDTAKVYRAADIVRNKAQAHHEKHRERWVMRQYGRLLTQSALSLTLNPPGVVIDPKARLMQQARQQVEQRHVQRLHAINKVQKSMLSGGKMRESRSIAWGGQGASKVKENTPRVSRGVMARIDAAQDRARRRANLNYTNNHIRWTQVRYHSVLGKMFAESDAKSPAPKGMKEAAWDIAANGIAARHAARLKQIDAACGRMRESGNIRASRPIGRNLGLGD